MDEKLKVAVVGCGDAAKVGHLPWYAVNPHVRIVGLADSDISRAEFCFQKWGGRAYDNISEMLRHEKPDMVSICTPVYLHAQHTIECALHGSHILCEKPMAPTLEESQQMIDAARKKGVILGMGLNRRFNTGLIKLRELIHSGQIGRILFARAHWIVNYPPEHLHFRAELRSGGGVFLDVGSHFVDLCRWLFDNEITTVQGLIAINYPEILEVEDHAVAMIEFQNGTTGLIETSWVGPSSYIREHLEETWIYGTEGAIKVDFPSSPFGVPKIEVWSKKTCEWQILPLPPFDKREFTNSHYKRMIDEFVSCVQEKRRFVPSGEDGKKAQGVILGLYQSWHEGQKIKLPLEKSPNVKKIFVSLKARESVKRAIR